MHHNGSPYFPSAFLSADIPAGGSALEADSRFYYDVRGLAPYNSFQFRVRAGNQAGIGPASKPSG